MLIAHSGYFVLQLQELRGNIRVFCRPRKDDRCNSCLKFPSEQDIMVTNDNAKKIFSFDKVFTSEATQEEVRHVCRRVRG